MIMPTYADADAVWARVVRALAAGLLGSFAKISSNRSSGDRSEKRVICVYVDPFWDDDEMKRVLRGLREDCSIREELKFKADAVTLLGIYEGNEYGIPPSFFVSLASSLVYKPLVPGPQNSRRRICIHFETARGCKFGEACRFAHVQSVPGQPYQWTSIICDGCNQEPLEGARYMYANCIVFHIMLTLFRCQGLTDFDLCKSCFSKGLHSNHAFKCAEYPGAQPVLMPLSSFGH
jgi:hypothetical protein